VRSGRQMHCGANVDDSALWRQAHILEEECSGLARVVPLSRVCGDQLKHVDHKALSASAGLAAAEACG
jgi:hypothetical protein